jgi:hypothetical protein
MAYMCVRSISQPHRQQDGDIRIISQTYRAARGLGKRPRGLASAPIRCAASAGGASRRCFFFKFENVKVGRLEGRGERAVRGKVISTPLDGVYPYRHSCICDQNDASILRQRLLMCLHVPHA